MTRHSLAFSICVVGSLLAGVACSTGTSTTLVSPDGGASVDAAGPDTGGRACKEANPASQGASEPCCAEWGADACGAGLFCAAFDGRAQTTCYPDHSRLGGDTCAADAQCASGSCAASSVCKGVPGGTCDLAVGCGTPAGSQSLFYCANGNSGPTCQLCRADSEVPACTTLPDGGPVPNKCVSQCQSHAQCQGSCPPVSNRVACCDAPTGSCFLAATCP